MKKMRKGDIVGRISYGKDIIFIIERIDKLSDGKEIAILKGITERIKVDSEIDDLCKIGKKELIEKQNKLDTEIEKRILRNLKKEQIEDDRSTLKVVTGKILHLDGDKKYSEKSQTYYQKMGLTAIVKNIPENKQSKVVYSLLQYYQPDILVITGHDGMIRKTSGYNDIYNYRNSRHFIETVKEARRYDRQNNKNTVIFAGACQSYFEALISAGANFASSPARILIDILDPLIVAEQVAKTDEIKFITIYDFEKKLRDGTRGVGGIGAKRKATNYN